MQTQMILQRLPRPPLKWLKMYSFVQTTFAIASHDLELARSLIANAVSNVQYLRLHQAKPADFTVATDDNAACVRDLFWSVYTVDKPFMMRIGASSVSRLASLASFVQC